MPPRSETLPGGILKLTKLLEHLNASPKLSLFGVKRLRLSLASQNDHFGARHFIKEDLPRIRWANPHLPIEVQREMKTAKEQWKAQMEVELQNGHRKTLDMQDKWSSTILKELMDLAGGEPWARHVKECERSGEPILPPSPSPSPSSSPSDPTSSLTSSTTSSPREVPLHLSHPHHSNPKPKKPLAPEGSTSPLPTLSEFLAANPSKHEEHLRIIEARKAKKAAKSKSSKKAASSTTTTTTQGVPPPNPFVTSEASVPPP